MFNQQPMYSNMYNQPKQAQKTQPLNQEQINFLRSKGGSEFSMQLSEREQLEAICSHKDPANNGDFTLNIDRNTGEATCTICGANFPLLDIQNENEIKNSCDNVAYILENIKTFYLDMPYNVATDLMVIIPILKRIPELFKVALKNFKSHEVAQYGTNRYGTNAMAIYSNLSNPIGTQATNYFMSGMNPTVMQQQAAMNAQMMTNPDAYFQQSQQGMANMGMVNGMMNFGQPQTSMSGVNSHQVQMTPEMYEQFMKFREAQTMQAQGQNQMVNPPTYKTQEGGQLNTAVEQPQLTPSASEMNGHFKA